MKEWEGSGVQQREGVNGVCTSIYQQPERSIPKHLPASDASQDAAPPPPAVAALPPLLAPFSLSAPLLLSSLLLTSSPAAAAYLTWISASAWRLTSAKIMREMWSNSSRSNRAAAGTEPGFKSMASALLLLLPTSTVVATDRIIIN